MEFKTLFEKNSNKKYTMWREDWWKHFLVFTQWAARGQAFQEAASDAQRGPWEAFDLSDFISAIKKFLGNPHQINTFIKHLKLFHQLGSDVLTVHLLSSVPKECKLPGKTLFRGRKGPALLINLKPVRYSRFTQECFLGTEALRLCQCTETAHFITHSNNK